MLESIIRVIPYIYYISIYARFQLPLFKNLPKGVLQQQLAVNTPVHPLNAGELTTRHACADGQAYA